MIVRAFIRVAVIALTLLVIARYEPGITISGFTTALVVAILWGLISLTIKPILNLITLPINILTFGLFSLVVNALLFWLLSLVVPGFSIASFTAALIASVLLSLVSWVLHQIL